MKTKFCLIKLALLSSLAVAADSENNSNLRISAKSSLTLNLSEVRKRLRPASGQIDPSQIATSSSPLKQSPKSKSSPPSAESPTAKFSPPSDHFETYAQFYAELKKGALFIEDFNTAVTAGSLSSTLFRANEHGESVERVVYIVKQLSARGSDILLTYEDQRLMVSQLIEIWDTMCQTHDTFIEKTVMKCIAKYILDGNFESAAALVDGAKKNLDGFITLFIRHGQFLQDLLDSQRDLLIYGRVSLETHGKRSKRSFKHLSVASNANDETSVTTKATNSDFSIVGLKSIFETRLAEVHSLASLLPSTQDNGLDLLASLTGADKKDVARSHTKLTRKSSKMFRQPSASMLPRTTSVSSMTAEYPSPNSPRFKDATSSSGKRESLDTVTPRARVLLTKTASSSDTTVSSESPPQSMEKKPKKEKKK